MDRLSLFQKHEDQVDEVPEMHNGRAQRNYAPPVETPRVYIKTREGVNEVSKRSAQVSAAARRALIMIDGKRSIAQLAALLAPIDIENVITQLATLGLIERREEDLQDSLDVPTIGGHEDSLRVNTQGARNTFPPSDGRTTMTLDQAKRRAVRELNERLGPDAELMSVRLEHCRTVEEFRECIRKAEHFVSTTLGPAAGQQYLRALRNSRDR